MQRPKKRKCLHCRIFFHADPRNAEKQRYCPLPACRKASKAASQQLWLAKPENRTYFSGPDNTKRVQQWRLAHPGYWRKKPAKQEPLQDHSTSESTEPQSVSAPLPGNALQDLLSAQPVVFLGLLAQLIGSPLQDDIVTLGRRLQQLGQDILVQPYCCQGGQHECQQGSPLPRQDPPRSGTVQLGRPPPGP